MWYQTGAMQGYAKAQLNLGIMHALGRGLPHDDEAAVYWFSLAAEQGLDRAMHKLGIMLKQGRGVAQSDQVGDSTYCKR